jgi:hypothetical protein
VESDGVDTTTEKEKQPRTELLDCVTELLEEKLNEVMNQIRFLPPTKQISEAIRSEVRSAVADAFRKERSGAEAREPKQPAQLSQAASVEDLVSRKLLRHGTFCWRLLSVVQDVLQRRQKQGADRRGHYTIPELGVFATNQKLRYFKHNVKQHYEDSMMHQLKAKADADATRNANEQMQVSLRVAAIALNSRQAGEGGEKKGGRRKGEGGRRGGGRGGGPYI